MNSERCGDLSGDGSFFLRSSGKSPLYCIIALLRGVPPGLTARASIITLTKQAAAHSSCPVPPRGGAGAPDELVEVVKASLLRSIPFETFDELATDPYTVAEKIVLDAWPQCPLDGPRVAA